MKQFIKTLKYLKSHPLTGKKYPKAIIRLIIWQIKTRLNDKFYIINWINDAKFIAKRGLKGITGNIYAGLHEFHEMSFLLHFLRPEDIFYDVGANVGSYSILSAKCVGAETVSIEPIPETYKILLENIKLNNIDRNDLPLNIGLGSKNEIKAFTKNLGAANHVIKDNSEHSDLIQKEIRTLDSIAKENIPRLIKMDVEGFEFEILQGGIQTLSNSKCSSVIVETNGSGLRYGYKDNEIHLKLLDIGFKPISYNPFHRNCTEVNSYNENGSTIYVKDIVMVSDRVKSAKNFKVLNLTI